MDIALFCPSAIDCCPTAAKDEFRRFCADSAHTLLLHDAKQSRQCAAVRAQLLRRAFAGKPRADDVPCLSGVYRHGRCLTVRMRWGLEEYTLIQPARFAWYRSLCHPYKLRSV